MIEPYFLFRSPILRAFAGPAARIYGLALSLRPIPSPARISVPVISVGNVHAGGVGKTPMVIAIARWLSELERHPAVVSRGYRGRLSGVGAEVTSASAPGDVGDEPIEIARACPDARVVIGARRTSACRHAARSCDIIVLDDAFQHRAVARDLDLVVVPAGRDPRRETLLPLGHLREPIAGIGRADALIALQDFGSRDDFTGLWQDHFSGPVIPARKRRGRVRMLAGTASTPESELDLGERLVVAFSAIERPERFHAALEEAGARVVARYALPDHSNFGAADLQAVSSLCAKHNAIGITTEKDSARLGGTALSFPAAVLGVEIESPELKSLITEKFRKG